MNTNYNNINEITVWTAIITPMLDDGQVDYESLAKLLKLQAEAGNGILLLGSTGEALNINEDEKKQILEFGINQNLDVPLMCGIGGINLDTQSSWIEYLNGLDLDAYLLVVPLYAKPGVYGQFEWFKALLDTSVKPCMIYNVPGRTAKKLEPEALEMFADHENFWAIKESSASEKEFANYQQTAPRARMMSGDDPMLPAFAKLGAKGVVSVAANVWPNEVHEYAKQCLENTLSDKKLWYDATNSFLSLASNPVPVKSLMADIGMIETANVRVPLSSKDMQGLDKLMAYHSDIKQWLTDQN